MFILFPDHKARDVLEEDERHAPLAAELDEVRSLQGAFREKDSIVGEDTHGKAHPSSKTAHQCGAIERLELVEFTPIHQPGDDFFDIKGLTAVLWEYAVDFGRVIKRV